MPPDSSPSEYRFEKRRADVEVTLTSGEVIRGCFFIASGDTRHEGPELVANLLNEATGFVPFERLEDGRARTVLLHLAHVVSAALAENEGSRHAGYEVATVRVVSMRLSTGTRLHGKVHVYRPESSDRLSDWTKQPEVFRYLETDTKTLLINMAHVVEVSEVAAS